MPHASHRIDRSPLAARAFQRPGRVLSGLAGLALLAVPAAATTAFEQPSVSSLAPGTEIIREGSGERREKLDAMERQPLARDVWSSLSGWAGSAAGEIPPGTPLTARNTAGKVVVFYTWASYYPTSLQPLFQLGRLQQELGDQGLVIVAVHAEEGFEDAGRKLAQRRAELVSAHDATGAFRKAMMSDQDPDFYIVDRAGQLRFADTATQSVEAAVRLLVAEKADESASLNDRLAAESERREREFRRLSGIRQQIEIRDLPRVPFIQPSPESYDSIKWPEIRTGDRSRGRDVFEPSKATLPDEGWTPSKPEPYGQGMVVWFWDPLDRSTFDQEMAWAEEMQAANQRDLIVVGVAMSTDEEQRRSRNNDTDEEAERRNSRRSDVYGEMLTGRTLKQAWLTNWTSDFTEQALSGLEVQAGRNGRNAVMPFLVSVISSDGVVRWVGVKNDQRLEVAIETLLRKDPGIVARRAAEQAFIKKKQAEETGVEAGMEAGDIEADAFDSDG